MAHSITTIATDGRFGTVTDRIASIATGGRWLEVVATAIVGIIITKSGHEFIITSLDHEYIIADLDHEYILESLP